MKIGPVWRCLAVLTAATSLGWLEAGGWSQLELLLGELERGPGKVAERAAAGTLQQHLSGLGPKQSRNMLQWLL